MMNLRHDECDNQLKTECEGVHIKQLYRDSRKQSKSLDRMRRSGGRPRKWFVGITFTGKQDSGKASSGKTVLLFWKSVH